MKVTFVFRKNRSGAFSIEELFNSIYNSLVEKCVTSKYNLSSSGASFKCIWGNLKEFKKLKHNSVYHITGEVNYMALITGKKTVLTIHDVNSAFGNGFIKDLIIKLLWFYLPSLFVKRITVISEFSKMQLSKVIPWAKRKIVVIYNPVNDLIYSNKVNLPVLVTNQVNKVLHIGTKSNKNLERTIEALANKRLELTIIGKLSPDHQSLLSKYKINFVNKFDLTFGDIIEEYKKTDLVSFISLYEGFGMPIIEAQTLGKPIVTSNVGAMKEIAGDGAVLVNPHSVEEMSKAFDELIENKELRESIIKKGLKNISRFEMPKISNQYFSIYKEIWNDK